MIILYCFICLGYFFSSEIEGCSYAYYWDSGFFLIIYRTFIELSNFTELENVVILSAGAMGVSYTLLLFFEEFIESIFQQEQNDENDFNDSDET